MPLLWHMQSNGIVVYSLCEDSLLILSLTSSSCAGMMCNKHISEEFWPAAIKLRSSQHTMQNKCVSMPTDAHARHTVVSKSFSRPCKGGRPEKCVVPGDSARACA